MPTETLSFGKGVVEATIIDNIIYMKILHFFTDDMAIALTGYLDKLLDRIPGKTIRIWDISGLPPQRYQLSNKCVRTISTWAEQLKTQKPGSRAYFIAESPLTYGVSRMYELQSGDEAMSVIVLRSVDELPEEVRAKLTTYTANKTAGDDS